VLNVVGTVILPVFAVAAIGGYFGRRLGFSVETFSKAVFFLFSPALVFRYTSTLELDGTVIVRITILCIAVFVANNLVALTWSRIRGEDARTRASGMLTASVANQGNLGLPVAKLAFGDAGLQVAVLVYVVGVVMWSSAGIAIGSVGHVDIRRALTAPLRYPLIYAACFGTLANLTNVNLPTIIDEPVAELAGAAIPAMLIVLGLQFSVKGTGSLIDPIAASINRLIIGPLVAWPIAILLQLDGVTRGTAILSLGMPTAVLVIVLTTELGCRPDLAVRTVVVSTAMSVASLSVLVWLVR
jgi:predicted permease